MPAEAYNDAIDKAQNDLIIFAHQDVIFPEQWLPHLERVLQYLEENDPQWGVLGCYGKTRPARVWGISTPPAEE